MYADVTRHEENAVGPDWLWWWIDYSGECFGMLVQAKRLHHKGTHYKLDFTADKGEQMACLFQAADQSQVPATYVLYLGSAGFRAGLTCGPRHIKECARRSRTSMSALLGGVRGRNGQD